MTNNNASLKSAVASVFSAIVAVLFLVVITVAADLAPELKNWLKAVFTHHWIGKGVLATLLFFATYLFLRAGLKNPSDSSLPPLLRLLSWLSVLGTIVLFAFFFYEAFGK